VPATDHELLAGPHLYLEPDRRRSIAVGGYTTTAVLSAGIGAATATWQVGLLRAGAWTARGLRVPARNALLADVVPAKAYGRAYGFERAMDNLGAIGGPLAAIALVAAVGTRWAIGVSVIPGLLAAAAIVYAIRHTTSPTRTERQPLRIRIRPVLTGPLRPMFAGISAFELGNCAATLLILRATQLLEPGRSTDNATTTALWLYVGYNLAATLTSLAAGRYTDRTDATRVLAAGVAAFALAYLGFTHDTHTPLALLPWFVLAGIGIGCAETAEHACRRHPRTHPAPRLRLRAPRRHPKPRQPRPPAPSPDSSGPPSAPAGPSPTSPPAWPSPSQRWPPTPPNLTRSANQPS
jgi:MFS family permease